MIFFIKKYKQYYSPKVNGLGPREKPKEGVFINSKLESVDIFLGESEPDPDSCRLSCADTEEILRCNVPEFIVDESFGDEFGAGLGDPIGKEAKHIPNWSDNNCFFFFTFELCNLFQSGNNISI